jgi:hypothetical protein
VTIVSWSCLVAQRIWICVPNEVVPASTLAGYKLTIGQASRDPNGARTLKEVLVSAPTIVSLVELKILKHRTSSYMILVRFLYDADFHNLNY